MGGPPHSRDRHPSAQKPNDGAKHARRNATLKICLASALNLDRTGDASGPAGLAPWLFRKIESLLLLPLLLSAVSSRSRSRLRAAEGPPGGRYLMSWTLSGRGRRVISTPTLSLLPTRHATGTSRQSTLAVTRNVPAWGLSRTSIVRLLSSLDFCDRKTITG